MATRMLSLLTILGLLGSHATVRHDPWSSASARQSANTADSLEQLLTAIERQSWVAWQHHDGKFFASFLSDDHVEVGTGGLATKSQVVAFVASGACAVKSYAVDHFHVTRFDENTALLTYRAEQDTMCGKSAVPSPAWVSSLFVLRNGKWVNALYQDTKAE
jgi:hypothetical protein